MPKLASGLLSVSPNCVLLSLRLPLVFVIISNTISLCPLPLFTAQSVLEQLQILSCELNILLGVCSVSPRDVNVHVFVTLIVEASSIIRRPVESTNASHILGRLVPVLDALIITVFIVVILRLHWH